MLSLRLAAVLAVVIPFVSAACSPCSDGCAKAVRPANHPDLPITADCSSFLEQGDSASIPEYAQEKCGFTHAYVSACWCIGITSTTSSAVSTSTVVSSSKPSPTSVYPTTSSVEPGSDSTSSPAQSTPSSTEQTTEGTPSSSLVTASSTATTSELPSSESPISSTLPWTPMPSSTASESVSATEVSSTIESSSSVVVESSTSSTSEFSTTTAPASSTSETSSVVSSTTSSAAAIATQFSSLVARDTSGTDIALKLATQIAGVRYYISWSSAAIATPVTSYNLDPETGRLSATLSTGQVLWANTAIPSSNYNIEVFFFWPASVIASTSGRYYLSCTQDSEHYLTCVSEGGEDVKFVNVGLFSVYVTPASSNTYPQLQIRGSV